MKVLGYADRLSVAPGDKIRFMVSCELPSYQMDIVRLIHGDVNPAGPGFKEELVRTTANREYPGRPQKIYVGSHVTVPDNPLLHVTGSFTLQAWVYPTTPAKGAQGLVTKWSSAGGVGYGLFIDQDGSLALWLADQGGKVHKVKTGKALRAFNWYFVAGVFDAQRRTVMLYQEPLNRWTRDDSRAFVEQAAQGSAVGGNDLPLLIAGHWAKEPSGKQVVQGHYNGKIDSPRLFNRALSQEEVRALGRGQAPIQFGNSLVAAWDFARDFSTDTITDSSPNKLHGEAVNMPMRAGTGYNWSANEVNFNLTPHEYGAIHFHDDDLEDAKWEVDFELTVPDNLRSGIYAARLKAGEHEDYVPFFVRPRKGTATAPLLFLIPTCSYMAYANFHGLANPEMKALMKLLTRIETFEYPVTPQDKYMVDVPLSSLYDRHSDGSGVCYSSRMRPILSMRPKYVFPLLGNGNGAPHQFNADLHLADWLKQKGYQFDVATDEDLHLDGAELLKRYTTIVTGSHPEYWTRQMLDAMETYMAGGGRLMYLGGNGFYWVTSFGGPEHPHVVEVRRWRGTEAWEAAPGEFYHSTTGELGGLWRFRGRPPQRLTGVGFSAQGTDFSLPYTLKPGSKDPRAAFILEGVDTDKPIGDFGLVQGGAGGFEVDRADQALGTPAHALVVATTTGFSDAYQHVVEEVLVSTSTQGGTVNPLVKGDMVFFEGANGGGVFSVGSISWCGSLSHNNYDNSISRITQNVLNRFLSEDPIK
ncbi:MAG: LamG domain-containing protein [Dehalococcoidia bacterium]|nr:LamG domain-containing protein [Dehalococcoidia bacterium]